jgi:hypothetical protein
MSAWRLIAHLRPAQQAACVLANKNCLSTLGRRNGVPLRSAEHKPVRRRATGSTRRRKMPVDTAGVIVISTA